MKKLLTVSFLLFVSLTLPAEIRLPSIITDGMVIQRERPVLIWGQADEKEDVTVIWKGEKHRTKADKCGKWSIELPASEAGGPFTMKKKGKLTPVSSISESFQVCLFLHMLRSRKDLLTSSRRSDWI